MRTIISSITVLSTTLCLFACQGPESEASDSYELRGGALITPADGTNLDIDELDAREGYGTTLTEADGTKWFLRVEHVDADDLDALGLEPIDDGGVTLHVGVTESDGDDDCRVYMPVTAETFVLASRPVGELGCPDALEQLDDWLPAVAASDEPELLRAFGDSVGWFNGVTAYSNGWIDYDSRQYSDVGLKWQCVEYVNRYYYQKLAHKNLIRTGHAKHYYGTADAKDLIAHPNGATTVKPAVGDMLVSNSEPYGHIAIIRDVGAHYVRVIHQNWSNSDSDNSKTLSLSQDENGTYTVEGFSHDYPVDGWLRRKPMCMPSITWVTPTTAILNQPKQFTGWGSCLSTTTTAPFIEDCDGLIVNNRTSTSITFTCTPKWTTGLKSGVIKHASGGTVLENFWVSVRD